MGAAGAAKTWVLFGGNIGSLFVGKDYRTQYSTGPYMVYKGQNKLKKLSRSFIELQLQRRASSEYGLQEKFAGA